MNLSGAIAVVTGGGSGLGEALVKQLAEAGAVPVVIDLRAERVSRVVDAVRPRARDTAGWTCDIGDRKQVALTFAEIGERFRRIDLLINCAGRSMLRPFLDMTDEDIDWVLGPNLMGVVYCIRAAVRWMGPGSRIVNVTSASGALPTPGEGFYSGAKAAVVSLTASLEAELADRKIGVSVVLPGEMSTALFAEHPSWELRPDFQRRMEIPPERVARAILRGVRANRFEIVCPWNMRIPLLLYRIAPGLFRRGVEIFYYRKIEGRIRMPS